MSETFRIENQQESVQIIRSSAITFVQGDKSIIYHDDGSFFSFSLDDQTIVPITNDEKKSFQIIISKYEQIPINKKLVVELPELINDKEFNYFLDDQLPTFHMAKIFSNRKMIGHLFVSHSNKTYEIIKEILRGAQIEKLDNAPCYKNDIYWCLIKSLQELDKI